MSNSIHVLEAIGYTVVMTTEAQSHCEFKIYKIERMEVRPSSTKFDIEKVYFYEKKNTNCHVTSNLEDSVVFMTGSVKWDGCSNWSVDNDGTQINGCSREDLINIGIVMASCYDLAMGQEHMYK